MSTALHNMGAHLGYQKENHLRGITKREPLKHF